MGAVIAGLVYATTSRVIRRVIVPDDFSELAAPGHVGPGESLVIIQLPNDAAPDPNFLRQSMATALGIEVSDIPSGRMAAVDASTKIVVGFAMGDPSLDSIPGHDLISSDIAEIGWKITDEGWMVRKVYGDENGIVSGAVWKPPEIVEHCGHILITSDAKIGDFVENLRSVNVESSGTEMF